MSFPSVVHVSSTFESGAPQSYWVALFAKSPFSTFFRNPMKVIAYRCSCVLHQQVWSPKMLLRSAIRQFSILQFFSETHECHCLALFKCPPPSSLEPREVIP